MKKVIIVLVVTLVIGCVLYWVYRQGYLPGIKGDTYEYKSKELKTISEEAGINLEKAMVEQPKQEETFVYEKQKEESLTNRNNLIYRGKLIINESNNKEWLVKVGIAKEEDKKYGIWKQEGLTNIVFVEELKSSGYEEWEYKSEGKQELKGKYYIGVIGEGNALFDTFYTIQK
jgi:hypothetical protein